MRSLGGLVLLLLVISSYAISSGSQMNSAQQKKLQEIVQDKKWASILMNLAELHLMSKGPIENLVQAIQDVVSDLEIKTQNTHVEYDLRTNDHQSETRRLNDQITNTVASIASLTEHINNILIPQRNQLNEELTQLNDRVEDLNTHIEKITEERKLSHEEHLLRVQEHTDGIQAVSEALQLLDSIQNGEVSLIQVNQAKKSLEKVANKIKSKSVESALVEALLQTTTDQFSNSENLSKVFQLLLEIRERFETSLQEDHTTEQKNQEDFEADEKQSKQDINLALSQISERQTQLQYTEEQIEENKQTIEQKQADKIVFENELQAENDSYDRATEAYNSLIEQYDSELAACQEALDIVENISLADYIKGRVDNESGVIDQSVGQRYSLNE